MPETSNSAVVESGEKPQTATTAYLLGIAALLAATVLRFLLDPWLGDSLPFVTLFGAIAAAVWLGGIGPGLLVAVLGYLACDYSFIQPRGQLALSGLPDVIGLAAYAFTSALILGFGQAARRAHLRAIQDVSEQRRLEKEKAQQLLTARLLGSIIESSDDAIISKSLAGIIQSWNAGAERLFGYSAEQAVGRHISLIIPPDRLKEEGEIIAKLRAGQRIEHFETERQHADGHRLIVSLTISPLKDAAGTVIGASKIARDVTAQRRAEDNLRRLASDLAEADRRKNEFLAMLAHELRNPLAPISNAARVLRLGDEDPHVVRSASEMLERQVGQMTRLVDDLLDMSRITRGSIELRKRRVELAPVVQQAIEAVRAHYDSMQHELTVSLPPQAVHLHVDPARLAQVIGNLLNNACKFMDRGGHVSLTVDVRDGEAVIRVRDTGIGIAPEQLTRVFDMFTQVDTSLERSRDGLGLGLTLVKTLVELHDGRVEAHSDGLGRGSEFIVRLPIAEASNEAPLRPSPAAPPPAVSRRVLVVDDSHDGAESLAMLLRFAGHQTWKAHDGLEAIEVAERLRPEVVLLDIGLPRMNGYEACRRIRQAPWGKTVVVVALTGWGQEDDRVRSREAGFDAHMVKPVDHDELLEFLETLPSTPNSRSEATS